MLSWIHTHAETEKHLHSRKRQITKFLISNAHIQLDCEDGEVFCVFQFLTPYVAHFDLMIP